MAFPGSLVAMPWQFDRPLGVAVTGDGVVHVADPDRGHVARFTLDRRWLEPITDIEGFGSLATPTDVAVSAHGRRCIADPGKRRVVVVSATGQLHCVLGIDDELGQPQWVATNPAGEIFVADVRHGRIARYSPDGAPITSWLQVPDPNDPTAPHEKWLGGIACDDHGFVYVRNPGQRRIHQYTENGLLTRTFVLPASDSVAPVETPGLAIAGNRLWVTEAATGQLLTVTLDGTRWESQTLTRPGGHAHPAHPTAVTTTGQGRLIVTDTRNHRVLHLGVDGVVLDTWGRTLEDLLSYEPPHRIDRRLRPKIIFSIYGTASIRVLNAVRDAGIERVYVPTNATGNHWPDSASLSLASAMGIEVHPSVSMLTSLPGGVSAMDRHPELGMWTKDSPAPLQTVLSWAQQEARLTRVEHLDRQLAASPVSGVMLDYIRYVDLEHGYDPIAIDGFFRRHLTNPLTLRPDDPRWIQYRADFITDFLTTLRRRLAEHDRDVHLSIFSAGDGRPKTALRQSMQDWRTWARMGLIDTLQVAQYTRDISSIFEAVHYAREAVPPRTRINCFLACGRGHLDTPALLRKGFDAARAAGADEITLYHSDDIFEMQLWDALVDLATATDAPP